MSRAIVLGAGVLGASAAYHLALAGAEVTVLEAGGPASGTSSATFSIDVTHLKTPRSYYELNRLSAEEHIVLAEELGAPSWRHPMPLIQWGHTAREQQIIRDRAVRLRSWGHPCRFAEPTELNELAPTVDAAACAAEELVVHDRSAWYDAPLFVRSLLDRAALMGADIRYGLRVTGMIRSGDRIVGVESGSRRWEADWVVNCAGPDADRIARHAGVSLPLKQIPGLVGESTPVPEAGLSAIVAAPDVDLRPAPGSRICSISWSVDAMLSSGPASGADLRLEEKLHRLGQEVLPALRTARLAGARLGVRPVPADGLPLIGTTPQAEGLYHLVTHSGVNLAPVLGRLAVQEMISDQPDSRLAPYRPGRDMPAQVQDESLQVMSDQPSLAGN
ncbi:NAD(P)/FAD-dependent oxidoreductase [Streptomyces sp. 3N207]|uniref:NAD(P)/FAD-dependent oxidoreductase n=1 Tax=Streptomyces sp. 3N207 TaxID=3457417 RepID=UPI003FD62E32